MRLRKRLGVAAELGDVAHRVALRQPVQRTLQRPSRLRRVQRPRLHRKHPVTPCTVLRQTRCSIGRTSPARSRSGDQREFVWGERQHVPIAIEPNPEALGTHGTLVPHRYDAATAAGDLTGAFSHAHPRLHTIRTAADSSATWVSVSPPRTTSPGSGSMIAPP